MSRNVGVALGLPRFAADPTTPTLKAGDKYWNTVSGVERQYDGSAWHNSQDLDGPLTGSTLEKEAFRTGGATGRARFLTALANCDVQPCDIFVIGDSMREGQGATTTATRSVTRMLDAMREEYQPRAIPGGRGWIPSRYVAPTLIDDNDWTNVGSPSAWDIVALGGRGSTVTTSITKTIVVFGTSIDVYYSVGAAGTTGATLRVTIDGAAQTAIATYNITTTTPFSKTSYTFAARGFHTIKFDATVSGTIFEGLTVYDGDESAGIRMWEACHYGWTTKQYSDNLINSAAGIPTGWSNSALGAQLSRIQPSVVIINLGTNDYGQGSAVSTYISYMNRIIAEVKANCTIKPWIIIEEPHNIGTAATPNEPLANWVAGRQALVAADPDLDYLDLSQRIPSMAGATDPLGLTVDFIHYSDKGHRLVGGYSAFRLTDLTLPSLPTVPVAREEVFSDTRTTLTTGTGTSRLYNRSGVARQITGVAISADTAPTTSALTIDVKKGGTTIFPTTSKPSIAAAGNLSTRQTPDVIGWADGEYLTIDITAIGSGTAGGGMKVYVYWTAVS